MVTLDRSYYRIHREIYEWVQTHTPHRWGAGYNITFGYQEIDFTPEEEKAFREWADAFRMGQPG